MSKRSGNFDNDPTKKTKITNLNDFWEDDLDGDLINDCFERATQICEEDKAHGSNVTLASSYSFFKATTKAMFTSTQNSQFPGPSTVEDRLKELKEKYAEKEGEVCILRENLQKLRTSCQTEQEKKDNEWKDKLNLANKENKTVRSELEFKNLEIANLKQQIAELSKCVNNEQTQKSKALDTSSIDEVVKEVMVLNPEIHINSDKFYPLKQFNLTSIFKPQDEEPYVIRPKYNLCKSTVSYLQIQPEEPVVITEKELNIDHIYPEIAFLMNLSHDELDSDVAISPINKIICVSIQLLTDFHDYLEQVEEHIQVEDIQEIDTLYLQGKEKYQNSKGIGIKCGKILALLAEIFQFNRYFRNYLMQHSLLNLNNNLEVPTQIKSKEKYYYLKLISSIVSKIGKTRKESKCSGFLSAVVKLLSKIFDNETNSTKDLLSELIKEVLFLRPNSIVIVDITAMLKIVSKTPNFMDFICFNSNESIADNSDNSRSKGVLYFTRESCRFHMLVILLENTIPKLDNENLLEMSSNILTFIHNIFKWNNRWLYQQENKQCACLCQLYKLGIGIIYKNLKIYQEVKPQPSVYQQFFENGVQVLSRLTFNSYGLVQKYVTVFAQFKEIVFTLLERRGEIGLSEKDCKVLEKMNVAEDIPDIPREKFVGIEL